MEAAAVNTFFRELESSLSREAELAAEIEHLMVRNLNGKEMAIMVEVTAWAMVVRIERALSGEYECEECSEPVTADNEGMLRFKPISFTEEAIEKLYTHALRIHDCCLKMLKAPVPLTIKRLIFSIAMEQRNIMNLAVNGILLSFRRGN